VAVLTLTLLCVWGVGIMGRGYWTPDEPREADIAWRMSWQPDKAVPLLAGEPFCEKPPLTYWAAGALIGAFGASGWSARLPNLLYALLTCLAVGLLARQSAGPWAAVVAAAASATFLLSYLVAIWLATDAPLVAAVAVSLLGAYRGFYARVRAERLRGYTLMHAALAAGFLSKSAIAWMVPALALTTLAIWERRWRELLRWELYAGLALQALVILGWVWFVYEGPDGPAHLKVFFWNNLAGRFARVEATPDLQYAAAHRNTPGKYLIELPLYLCPWTLLVGAALRRAWLARRAPPDSMRPVRFALACTLPPLALLSIAATARNIYLAPALPGFALLLGWWARETLTVHDGWDLRALRATALWLLIAVAGFAGAAALASVDAWHSTTGISFIASIAVSLLGLAAAAILCLRAHSAAVRGRIESALTAAFFAYCALLTAPSSQIYRQVNRWQDLASIGHAIEADAAGRPLILMAPDETTRAFIDMYARSEVGLVRAPVDADSIGRLHRMLASDPQALVVVQLPGRELTATMRRLADALRLAADRAPDPSWWAPPWTSALALHVAHRYALPNGRRYALLEAAPLVDKTDGASLN
jgi:4-amino-4-deoxy-L-arabinose transferase-like glycosyltransferase